MFCFATGKPSKFFGEAAFLDWFKNHCVHNILIYCVL
eukprot:UN00652